MVRKTVMMRFLAIAMLVMIAGCTTAPPKVHHMPETSAVAGCTLIESGLASWYGNEMAIGKKNGEYIFNKTASGETFYPNKISAAHRTLPFGTVVRVMLDKPWGNPNGVDVRINDRGPFVKGRIIDLSWGAAKELNMKDTQPVQVFRCPS